MEKNTADGELAMECRGSFKHHPSERQRRLFFGLTSKVNVQTYILLGIGCHIPVLSKNIIMSSHTLYMAHI